MGKSRRRHSVVYILALCFELCALSLTLFYPFQQAYAQSISVSVNEGGVYSCTLGRIDLYFGHNVAATDIIEQNKNHIWVEDENGVVIADGSSVWSSYTGAGAPDADHPDINGDRRYLYITIPPLSPDTGYVLVVTSGIVSQGNNTYDGLRISFRSDGEKPKSNLEPMVPDNPGDGGQGGIAGSNTYGDGLDSGESSNAVSDDDSSETSFDTSEISEDAALGNAATDESTANNPPSSVQSRAFGTGGGACYVVGTDKSKSGNIEQEFLSNDSASSKFFALMLGLMIVACVVFGVLRRSIVWHRQIKLS